MNKISLVLAFTISLNVNSQNLDYGNSSSAISICNALQGRSFASERVANSALDDILNVIGASKRFVLQECSNINNAVALTMNGVRYIMYDPDFMTSLSYGSNWGKKFILAHEVGHHINGHTVDVLATNSSNQISLETSRIQELEADEFAGFVLGRLGASLSEALSGVQSLSNEDDTYSTHPKRSKRIAAVKKGFTASGGN
ncbi:M48 family metalloprotease, partial [Schleiferiaceae bacterium]|nr:M48 family metalloprotease [Schleiferiaceae bacterium]